jgi:YHS domain-containing protein
MKKLAVIFGIALATGLGARAEDAKPTPDQLATCPVSGEKLGGDMGQPYVFVYKGQEVKLCCSMCKAKFEKDPDKFIAVIRAADKTDKK